MKKTIQVWEVSGELYRDELTAQWAVLGELIGALSQTHERATDVHASVRLPTMCNAIPELQERARELLNAIAELEIIIGPPPAPEPPQPPRQLLTDFNGVGRRG